MARVSLTSLFLVLLVFAQGRTSAQEAEKRQLSLFSVVTFPNDACTSTNSAKDKGTCYTATECASKGGTSSGNCASGFGVCCTVSKSACGSTVTLNTSYITNPSYPTAYTTTGSCSYSVTPLSSEICQIRLDFDNFNLADTATTGACLDSFDVTSSSSRVYPTLCGIATGQHIYIETGRATANQALKFTIGSSATWKARVTQHECSSAWKAPSDCFQYYTGAAGRVLSFNFSAQRHIWNMRYTACIRAEAGYCGIQWHPTSLASTNDNFLLAPTSGLCGAPAAAAVSAVIIPNSHCNAYSGTHLATNAQTSDSAVVAYGRPFHLGVTSTHATQANAGGFDLSYNQIPCGNAP